MEKVYKVMKNTGVSAIALGIIILISGLSVGILSIINGARLLKNKDELTF